MRIKFPIFVPMVLVLAACGDPMQNVSRLADQDVAQGAPTLDAVPTVQPPESQRVGLFARLLGNRDTDESPDRAAVSTDGPAAGEATVEVSRPKQGETQVPDQDKAQTRDARKGLLGRLFGGNSDASGDTQAISEIAYGTTLPYGEVKRICGLRAGHMGKVVARYPENRPVHEVYDSDPGNTAPHTFYVTGFDDGCARQFTASIAMFGSVKMHESLRYGLPAKVQPYSATDEAYETVKARVCRVARKTPCGDRVERLADDTVFLSIYERFGGNSQWKNLLLHSGEVVAKDKKGV